MYLVFVEATCVYTCFTHTDHGMLTGRATKAVCVLYLLARKALADFKLNTILTLGGVSVPVLGRTVKGGLSRWLNTRTPWAMLDNIHGVYTRMSTRTLRLLLRERAVAPHVLRGLRSPGQLQQYAAVKVSRYARRAARNESQRRHSFVCMYTVSQKTSHL